MADRGNRFLSDRLLRNRAFIICALAYAVFRGFLWLRPGWVPALLRNYLPDLLALPILLTLAVLLQRYLVLRNPAYRLNKWQVGFAVAYVSVMFELVFPNFYDRYTADICDVLAYVAGGFIYWRWINPKNENEHN